jgi:M3 family oligoendopeptidase
MPLKIRKDTIMKFSEFKYERPNLDTIKQEMESLLKLIGENEPYEVEKEAIEKVFKINDNVFTQASLVSVRNSIDTKDAFYEAEQDFFNENLPHLQQFEHLFIQKLLKSNHRKQLEDAYGKLIFQKGELAQKTFSPEIIGELQKENKLSTEYSKLLAGAKIEFEGGTYNLSQMAPFVQDKNRETRHKAQLAVSAFFADNEQTLDRIYDDMVKVRTEIAKKLGYENFVQLGYDRFGRTDYNAEDVKTYRDQIYEEIVPIVTTLNKRKGVRIGYQRFKVI